MKYMAVVGSNGFGLYTDTKMLLKAKPYVKDYNVRFFKDVDRALKWINNQYLKMHHIKDKHYSVIDGIKQFNWFYHHRL